MRPHEFANLLKESFRLPFPQAIFAWGPPGIGKSDLVAEAATAAKAQLWDIRASTLDVPDVRGLPYPIDGKTSRWLPPDFLPQPGERGILFIDEFNLASLEVAKAFYQLVLDRRIGNYILPEGVITVAAGNRTEDLAATIPQPPPLASRFIHVDLTTDIDSWTPWAIRTGIAPEVMAFLNFRPNLLLTLEFKRGIRAFPNPRSWAVVSALLQRNPPISHLDEMIRGCVGDGAAGEFSTYLSIYKELPNYRAILKGSKVVMPVGRQDILHAVVMALVAHSKEISEYEACLTFASTLDPEMGFLLAKGLMNKDKDIVAKCKAWKLWAAQSIDLLY